MIMGLMLVLLAGVVLCRTYWVGQQTAYAASAGGQSVQTLTLPRARGEFFDRPDRRLTCRSPQYEAPVSYTHPTHPPIINL